MKLSEFVDINPRTSLPKGTEAEFVPMEALNPQRRYVKTYPKKKYSGGTKFINGDTLFARITPCLENGKISQFISDSNLPAFGSTEYWVLRAKEGVSDPSYVYYLAKSELLRRPAEKSMVGASGRQRAQIESIQDIDIGNVSLDEQKKIAGALSAYDDLIENNSKRIEKLEAMACLLYRHYFEVPEATDWEELPLSEALLVHRGKSYKGTELSETQGLPFVNLKCVNRGGGFRKDGLKLFTGAYKQNQRVERGDLVMAVTDMTQERMIVARVARVPSLDGGSGVISMDMVKLEPKEGVSKDYLYAMLRWSRFSDEVKNHANGANVLHLLPARITDYSLPMPPQALQRGFAEKISPLFDLIDNLQLKNEALAKARDLLLPRLMSGEIDV